MIKTYQKADGNTKLGRNWTVNELWLDSSMPTLVIDTALIDLLDGFAAYFGKKPRFASKRSIYCKDGHSSNSYHYKGMAADFSIDGITPLALAQYAEILGAKGIGIYDGWDVPGRHIHIDTRSASKPVCWWIKTTGSNTPGFGPDIIYKQGHRSPFIILLQRALGGLKDDGEFGPLTDNKLRAYQKAHGLTVDGKAGPKTFASLGIKLVC